MADERRIVNPTGGLLSRINTTCPQIGIVKDNDDVENMGRLKVWIKGSNTLEIDPNGWITCSYMSPFAGATDPENLSNNIQDPNGTQQSYGFWGIPPDKNNLVIVVFINGDIKQAFWIGCLYQKNMNYMVPGIAGGPSFQSSQFTSSTVPVVPVSEYNKLGTSPDVRPMFAPLASGLAKQGLLGDSLRGAGASTARRESPSQVFGWKTPAGNQFVMDDETGNELIRLRTKSGAQILISETVGNIYFISKDGNNWVELNNDGNLDFYAGTGFNVYTKGTVNIKAVGDINLESSGNANITGKNVNLIATAGNVNITSSINTDIKSAGINLTASGALNQSVGGLQTTTNNGDIRKWQHNGGQIITDSFPHPSTINNGQPPAPESPATLPTNQISLKGANSKESASSSICTRVPDAEPWANHASVVSGLAPAQEGATTASIGNVTSNAASPLAVVGSPSKGMKPGVYKPNGYDEKGRPKFIFAGTTSELKTVNQLITSDQGLQFIKYQEGFRSLPYPDASGKAFDIGYAHTIEASDPPEVRTGPLSIEAATVLLKKDVKKFEDAIRKYVKVPLTQAQFDALVDFTYDVGPGRLASSTLLKELNQGNYADVPTQLSRWVYAGGKVLGALVRRRREEGLLFSTPVTTNT